MLGMASSRVEHRRGFRIMPNVQTTLWCYQECLAWAVVYEHQNPGWESDPRPLVMHGKRGAYLLFPLLSDPS